jgi:hypothetical protein
MCTLSGGLLLLMLANNYHAWFLTLVLFLVFVYIGNKCDIDSRSSAAAAAVAAAAS